VEFSNCNLMHITLHRWKRDIGDKFLLKSLISRQIKLEMNPLQALHDSNDNKSISDSRAWVILHDYLSTLFLIFKFSGKNVSLMVLNERI